MTQNFGFNELISSCEKLAQEVKGQLVEDKEEKPILMETQKSRGIDYLIKSELANNELLAAVQSEIAGNVFFYLTISNDHLRKLVRYIIPNA